MARQDYIPDPDANFLTWFQNFKTQFAALGATLGFTAGEIAADDADLTLAQGKLTTLTQKTAEKQAAASDKQTTFKDVKGRLRGRANRAKNAPAYTTTMGQQLGILGPEDTTDLTNEKPTLQASSINPGSVTIGFNKSISGGIRLESKRAAETAFAFLAIDTSSPYIDNRANGAAGPETRQYRAQYILGDDPIGNFSDVLTVTVPG